MSRRTILLLLCLALAAGVSSGSDSSSGAASASASPSQQRQARDDASRLIGALPGRRQLQQTQADCARSVPGCKACRFQFFKGTVTRAVCTQCDTGYVVKKSGQECCECCWPASATRPFPLPSSPCLAAAAALCPACPCPPSCPPTHPLPAPVGKKAAFSTALLPQPRADHTPPSPPSPARPEKRAGRHAPRTRRVQPRLQVERDVRGVRALRRRQLLPRLERRARQRGRAPVRPQQGHVERGRALSQGVQGAPRVRLGGRRRVGALPARLLQPRLQHAAVLALPRRPDDARRGRAVARRVRRARRLVLPPRQGDSVRAGHVQGGRRQRRLRRVPRRVHDQVWRRRQGLARRVQM